MQQNEADPIITELKAQIAELEGKNRELESTLFKIYLAGYPSPEGVEEIVEKADQERLRLKQQLTQWHQCAQDLRDLIQRFQNILPWDVIKLQDKPPDPDGILPPGDDWREIEWSNTQVGVSLFFRNSGKDQTQVWVGHGIFDGDIHQATQDVIEQVIFAMNRMPTLADLENKSLDGLTVKKMLLVLRELAYYRYMEPEDVYKQRRREIFNRIEESIVPPDEDSSRQEKMDRFYKLVEHTFEKYEKRRQKFTFTERQLRTHGCSQQTRTGPGRSSSGLHSPGAALSSRRVPLRSWPCTDIQNLAESSGAVNRDAL